MTFKEIVESKSAHMPDEPEYRDRLAEEVETIESLGYGPYFSLVSEMMDACRDMNVPLGPGRGSVCGSLVAWIMGITAVDPIRWGTSFDRFLHGDRNEPPDIDIDICQKGRGLALKWLQDKYGEDCVALITTHSRMMAKGVVRDVCRAWGIDEADGICKKIEDDDLTPEMFVGAESRSGMEKGFLYSESKRLMGTARHSSVHAAGVVVSREPLVDMGMPLMMSKGEEIPRIQFDMGDAEGLGFLKLDLLGLKTLTMLQEASSLVERKTPGFDVFDIDVEEDMSVYEWLGKGRTFGLFQIESSFVASALKRMNPTGFMDIVAVIALCRPGPMLQLDEFIERMNERKLVSYPHESLREALSSTYGLFVYQEQVMAASRIMARYTASEADRFRKGVGKKDEAVMKAQLDKFSRRCVESGHGEKSVEEVVSLIERFGRYGFNLSHAVGYSFIVYWTAYMKKNHPLEFHVALLNANSGDSDRTRLAVEEAKSQGIEVLVPCVNKSEPHCIPEGDAIRFGFVSVKGVGEKAVDALKAGRPWKNLSDFAFRCAAPINVKRAVISSTAERGDDADAAFAMCGGVPRDGYEADLAVSEVLGWAPRHPLEGMGIKGIDFEDDDYFDFGRGFKNVAVKVTKVKKHKCKTGMMAFVECDTYVMGFPSMVVFPREWKRYSNIFSKGAVLKIRGKRGASKNGDSFIVQGAKAV